LLPGLVALGSLLGCGETLKDTYTVDILAPNDAFAGATVVKLLVSGEVRATANVKPGMAFSLEAPDLDPAVTAATIFAIRAEDASGALVAFGQSPQVEVVHLSPRIRIFVQKPGTLSKAGDLAFKTKDHVAVPAESTGVGGLTVAVTVPVFGVGRTWVRAANGEQMILSNDLFVYNPLTHAQQGLATMTGGLRAEASAITRADRVYLFGGLAQTAITEPPKLSSQLDVFAVGREAFSSFFLVPLPPFQGNEGCPRRRTVLATTPKPVFAFGGLDASDQPLDSIVLLDETLTNPVTLLTKMVGSPPVPVPFKMAVPRVGHTVSSVATSERWGNILVYGGAPAGGPVAELLEPMELSWLTIDTSAAGGGMGAAAAPGQPGHPGTGRRDHVALPVTVGGEARILILGGKGDDGQPRGDSMFYLPAKRRFEPGPVNLKTARSSFAAFVINDDLVVAGGYGPGDKLLDNAEVYDTKSWMLVSETPAVARASATATALPNLSVVILGGATADSASSAVEIYQPRK
jgi:hypothetical protein